MNIFIVGNPGSGKGTQADLIAKKFDLYHFSTGEVFRSMVGQEAEEIKSYMNKGELVPDDLVLKAVENFLDEKKLYDNLIIDGSPRSLYQYNKFKDFFQKYGTGFKYAFYIKISDAEVVRRLTARRVNSKTNEIYNLITNPPGPEVSESDLVQRADDTEDVVKERLRAQKVPEELLSELRKDKILVEIDGERPIKDIFEDIVSKIKHEN